MVTNSLVSLRRLGQSPWYDNIDRTLIENGELKALFDIGVTGVTSNPSIFEKAINGSTLYDASINALAAQGKTALEICDLLTIQDVQSAADLLLDVYRESDGLDGYVSLEVNPEFAHDAHKTIEHAAALWDQVDRPNLMIKVPGTKEGPEAIEALIRRGININVTLLFSRKHYAACAAAYTDGLKHRQADGAPIEGVCSVASVFISRVDTAVDKRLDAVNHPELKGKTAVANAKMIYQDFKSWFFGDAFQDLSQQGGRIQRVLWGSTSTKNPDYSDVKYVEELIGKDTVNTLPHKTLEAFVDHGRAALTLEEGLEEAGKHLKRIQTLDLDLDEICDEIQEQGVDAFAASFRELIASIEKKAGVARD
ncbi:MAG: transaldolase [Deltaproteobacteria bacterium]|nr:transaldolase [Deltaproteobacteria bacterium]